MIKKTQKEKLWCLNVIISWIPWNLGLLFFEIDTYQGNSKIPWLFYQVLILWVLEKMISPTMSKIA
jgi:hypothetical protein